MREPDITVQTAERASSRPGDVAVEPDRHELHAPAAYDFGVTRRAFIGGVGGGVVVLVLARDGAAIVTGEHDVPVEPPARRDPISAWLHVAEDGVVTVYTGKVEFGQDIRTSLTQAVADELGAGVGAIRLVMGDTDLTPYDAGTFGSRTTPQMAPQLRRAAAAARSLLLERAAERWRVDPASLSLRDGLVHGGGRSVGIGELTAGESLVREIPADAATLPRDDWRIAGTSMPKVAARDIVTGAHRYASDLRADGMLVGRVLRPPSFGARLVSLDDAAARAMPGVVVVRDGDFVGVAAPDESAAARAIASLRPRWESVPQPSHRDVFAHLERTAGRATTLDAAGGIDEGLTAADERLEAEYTTACIAHVPLEPRAALARWDDDGRVTVHTGTQRPFGVRTELARAFRIDEARVRVIVPDTGAGWGGKHTGEVAVEAARLAREARRPVRLVWSREEEFTFAYFRPAALIRVRSGVRHDGAVTAWSFDNWNAGTAGIRMPYDVAHRRIAYHPSESPLRQGSYRALAATANNFARETHIDELAAAIGMDSFEFRLRNLREPRLRAVLEAAAGRFRWRDRVRSAGDGRGIGIACGVEKGGYVATCAEVEVDRATGRVRVANITEAFECGAIVSPDGVRNQIEGAVVMGLGGALWEAIEFEDGRILNPRLAQYRVPRFSDVPAIDIVLVDRPDLPSAGAGETPIITVAPAIASAIFAATGVRLRGLPLVPHGMP